MKTSFRNVIAAVAIVASTFGTVLPAFAAIPGPTSLTIAGGKYTNDTTPTFTWHRPANSTWYEILLDNGSWMGIGNVSSYTLWPVSEGWHTFFVRSHNNRGGVSESASITFEVDITGPTVSAVSPTSAKTNVPVTFAVKTTSNDVAARACTLHIEGNVYNMQSHGSEKGGSREFTLVYTFRQGTGDKAVYARCWDGDGNYTTGPSRMVHVTQGSVNIPYGDDGLIGVAKGTLIKTACDSYAPASDSCHSVYYYGQDGNKHAFTSEAVYKSWYGSSYASVKIVSNSTMKYLPVGESVTMRPGTFLVKFMGSSTVYAVEKGGILRPIVSESVARAIYGSTWAAAVVELPGSVRSDYKVGAKIYSTSDYSKVRAYSSVSSIDDNF